MSYIKKYVENAITVFIDNALLRYQTDPTRSVFKYYVNLLDLQERVTTKLRERVEGLIKARDIQCTDSGQGLVLTIDLDTVILSLEQTKRRNDIDLVLRSDNMIQFLALSNNGES